MTYKVSSEMLNPSIVYHTTQIVLLLSFTSDKYNYYYYYYWSGARFVKEIKIITVTTINFTNLLFINFHLYIPLCVFN